MRRVGFERGVARVVGVGVEDFGRVDRSVQGGRRAGWNMPTARRANDEQKPSHGLKEYTLLSAPM